MHVLEKLFSQLKHFQHGTPEGGLSSSEVEGKLYHNQCNWPFYAFFSTSGLSWWAPIKLLARVSLFLNVSPRSLHRRVSETLWVVEGFSLLESFRAPLPHLRHSGMPPAGWIVMCVLCPLLELLFLPHVLQHLSSDLWLLCKCIPISGISVCVMSELWQPNFSSVWVWLCILTWLCLSLAFPLWPQPYELVILCLDNVHEQCVRPYF